MNYKGNDKYGALPRRTVIANQPHMLAYINPQEEMLLRQLGGTGQPGPMGVPAYPPMGDYAYDGGAGTFSGGNGGGGGGVSANDYNAAIGRVNQTIGRDYNQGARNRDLATISSYNASFTPVNDPSEIATVEVEVAPVSIDSGMGAAIAANDGVSFTDSTSVPTSNIGVNTGLSGEEFDDIGVANNTGSGGVSAGVTGTDFDFGMGSGTGINVGVGTSAGDTYAVSDASEVTVDPTNTSGGTTTSIVGTSMFDNMRALRGLPPLGEIEVAADDTASDVGRADVDQDAGMGAAISANDGVSEIGSSGYDVGPSGYVSLDAISANDGISFTDSTSVPTSNIGVNTGLSGEEFDNIGVANNTGTDGASANVTGTDFDFGVGSVDGVSNIGVSDLGVSTETIGGNTGLSGEEFDNIGLVNTTGSGGVSAGVTGTDFDFGMGSDDGVGTSAGEGDVGITIDPYDNPYAIDITDTNIYTENPDGTYTVEDGEGGVDPYAIDITDTNIYTENPDGTYTVEDGEPDPIEMGGDGEGEPPANGGDGNGIDTTETTATTSIQDPAEYFNLFRSTAPSGWLRDSIWSSVGTGPDFDVDVYQEADGSLRFRETGELVPEEYMKYIDLARRTEMDAPGEDVA